MDAETVALHHPHRPTMASSSSVYENNNNMVNNTSNASISFDLTIELTASNDDESVNGPATEHHDDGAGIRSIGGDNTNQSNNKTAMMTIVPKKIIRNPKNGKYKIVLPLVSPDDGTVSVWGAEDETATLDAEEEEEASTGSSLASSKQSLAGSRSTSTTTSTNRLVRFQGITAYQYPGGFRGGVDPKGKVAHGGLGTSALPNSQLDQLQIDVERQRALRKRKERALIKIAKELSKRTHEVAQRDQRIAAQVDTIHQLEQQLLQQEYLAKKSTTTNSSSSAETAAAKDETAAHLRKELLRLQLSNDRLQLQLSNNYNSRIPPVLLALVLIAILIWLLQSTIFTAGTTSTSSTSCSS